MTEPSDLILDAAGHPIGVYRDNQDPRVVQRVHPVPAVNARGDVIVDPLSGEPVTHLLALDDPRVAEALAADGLVVDGTVIVTAES